MYGFQAIQLLGEFEGIFGNVSDLRRDIWSPSYLYKGSVGSGKGLWGPGGGHIVLPGHLGHTRIPV